MPIMSTFVAVVLALAALGDPPKRVTFASEDKVDLVADLYRAGSAKSPGVILLPMYGHARDSWRSLAPVLLAEGFTVLALDLRGHGESLRQGDRVLNYNSARQGGENLFPLMYRDVIAAKKYLIESAGVDPDRVSLVGASVGSSVAIDTAGHDPAVRSMVLLSPGKNYQGMDSMAQAKKVPRMPMLVLSNDREKSQAEDLVQILPGGAASLAVYDGAGHGTQMLATAPGIEKRIVDWLKSNG